MPGRPVPGEGPIVTRRPTAAPAGRSAPGRGPPGARHRGTRTPPSRRDEAASGAGPGRCAGAGPTRWSPQPGRPGRARSRVARPAPRSAAAPPRPAVPRPHAPTLGPPGPRSPSLFGHFGPPQWPRSPTRSSRCLHPTSRSPRHPRRNLHHAADHWRAAKVWSLIHLHYGGTNLAPSGRSRRLGLARRHERLRPDAGASSGRTLRHASPTTAVPGIPMPGRLSSHRRRGAR